MRRNNYPLLKKWRINRRFQSVTEVQRELNDKDLLLQTWDKDVEFGYVKPGHGAKGRQERNFSDKDLEKMYKEHIGKTEIMFWVMDKKNKRHSKSLRKGFGHQVQVYAVK